jgi:predicted nucleotidyltransferase
MNFAGIIAEYDPFHNGHALQIGQLRRMGAKHIAVCMSSGATQRGSVPVLAQQVRVRAALESGADLVVCLPAPYACAGAQPFAAAGVALLSALGCDTLAFGAETPDAARLRRTAEALDTTQFADALHNTMRQASGVTFAAARAAAAEQQTPGSAELLSTPNNILGVEYCRAIRQQKSAMQPLPLPRLGAAHDGAPGRAFSTMSDAPEEILVCSASVLRHALAEDRTVKSWESYVPSTAFALYGAAVQRGEAFSEQAFSVALLSRLRAKSREELAQTRGLAEGLENRLYRAIRETCTAQELYDKLKTKRYPRARLRRLALDAALDYGTAFPALPPYLHLLGARREMLTLLKNARLPVSTSLAKLKQISAEAAAVADAHSAAIDFSALCRQVPMQAGLAYTGKPVLLG